MDLTWKKIIGRVVIAVAVLLLSIHVVKITTGCKGNFYSVNYVLVAYVFVITLCLLKQADSMSGLNIQAKLTKNGLMENYRRADRPLGAKGAEYYKTYFS